MRTIAQILSIFVLLLGVPYLLFTGLQLISGEGGNLAILLYLLFLAGMLAGLVIAWWRESLGAILALVSLIGSFVLSGGIFPGVGVRQGYSLFAGPLNLLFALLIPGYHPDASPIGGNIPIEEAQRRCAPTTMTVTNVIPGSLGAIVRAFKSATTRRINALNGLPGTPLWQRNYYEHIIRNENELENIRAYVRNNPLQWELDHENTIQFPSSE